jgi:hypothetical protein
MKKTLLTLSTFILGTGLFAQLLSPPPPEERKVQVAILFDTSNSMDGLIDQAKARIWNIVNQVSNLRYNGHQAGLEIGLYQYGNDGLKESDNYVEQVAALTDDLDLISQKLFALTTNGGSEYCGAVIGRSLSELNWSTNPADLKMIYIAGNEEFDQGPIKWEEECKGANKLGVFINTIYCGPYDQGIREHCEDGALCSQGNYFNIDSDREVVHIDTPYDEEIAIYNDSLNKTYYGYGIRGHEKKAMQVSEDANAEMESVAVAADRTVAKSKKGIYKNSSWDLLDAVDEGEVELDKLEEEELPEEFKGKTKEEKEALIEGVREDRDRYQKKIAELAILREEFIADERKKMAETGEEADDFGTSVNKSIMEKAVEIGYE